MNVEISHTWVLLREPMWTWGWCLTGSRRIHHAGPSVTSAQPWLADVQTRGYFYSQGSGYPGISLAAACEGSVLGVCVCECVCPNIFLKDSNLAQHVTEIALLENTVLGNSTSYSNQGEKQRDQEAK